ncbi:carboxypeptidase-like regulatory domain-containing protein [Granulicella sp. dw_53]|uniref:carboxypeptidase-like regulatory domain-containing protein n=1 Tax=Granulicella sp. dw_53 TaxID=2719792 RepID=UPI001BD4D75F|nr:carboxypeptidase-like regulatory domain-containing protein [Granulicella sp. dw_53]
MDEEPNLESDGKTIAIPNLRNLSLLLLTLFIGAALCLETQAQAPPAAQPGALPDSPGQHTDGSISGAVTDTGGAEVQDANITLENINSKVQRTVITDAAGAFRFPTVEPGTFRLTVTAAGFRPWVATSLILQKGQSYEMPPISLQIASTNTNVEVVFSRHDLAQEQMKAEEKQRVLGFFPNFYVSYVPNAAPLSSGQKFHLALRTSVDPVSFAGSAVVAGIEQSLDTFSGYGQGAQGYAKRFGASYADGFISTLIGGAILPSVLHQDPRYFYKGTGSIRSRALYAISTVVICKGDNGRWQPNYSNVLGNLAAAGISNAYYPSTDRNGAGLTIQSAFLGTVSGAVGNLIQEFFIRRMTHNLPPVQPAKTQP